MKHNMFYDSLVKLKRKITLNSTDLDRDSLRNLQEF